jgi:predicted ribosomally synthesized peptide with nif11-like leader
MNDDVVALSAVHALRAMPMTIAHARKFVSRAMQDDDLRDALNAAEDPMARTAVLQEEGLAFSLEEFEEAWRNELTKCQTESQADALHDLNQWWQLLSHS